MRNNGGSSVAVDLESANTELAKNVIEITTLKQQNAALNDALAAAKSKLGASEAAVADYRAQAAAHTAAMHAAVRDRDDALLRLAGLEQSSQALQVWPLPAPLSTWRMPSCNVCMVLNI